MLFFRGGEAVLTMITMTAGFIERLLRAGDCSKHSLCPDLILITL